MKIITFEQIKKLNLDSSVYYHWVEDVIAHKKEMMLPAKISLKPDIPGVFYNTMPAAIPQIGVAGVKLVTRYPERLPSLDSEILLYDLSTGENLALVDGNMITAMRTGAVAAHSVKLFAKPGFSKIGIIGLGNVARATFLMLASVFPNKHFVVFLKKYKNQHELFAERFHELQNVEFRFCEQYEEIIENSEVVISAVTVFENDICRDDYFHKGVLVVPIHTRGFTNCDLFFDKVFADDINHVRGFKNFERFASFAEVSDVVTGTKPGRESDEERIIAYNIGIALHDLYFAGKLYELCSKDSLQIDLCAPKEKFWI